MIALDGVDSPALADLTREELVELVEQQRERGIRISFSGKANPRGLARRVRPLTLRQSKTYGVGPEEERARNLLIEDDNLQAMVTLYRPSVGRQTSGEHENLGETVRALLCSEHASRRHGAGTGLRGG